MHVVFVVQEHAPTSKLQGFVTVRVESPTKLNRF